MTKKATLHVNLTADQTELLKLVAFRANTSVSDVLRQLLNDPHNQSKLRRASKLTHKGIFQ